MKRQLPLSKYHRIATSPYFSDTLKRVASDLGFRTVGQLSNFVFNAKPTLRVGCGPKTIRLNKIRRELLQYSKAPSFN